MQPHYIKFFFLKFFLRGNNETISSMEGILIWVRAPTRRGQLWILLQTDVKKERNWEKSGALAAGGLATAGTGSVPSALLIRGHAATRSFLSCATRFANFRTFTTVLTRAPRHQADLTWNASVSTFQIDGPSKKSSRKNGSERKCARKL